MFRRVPESPPKKGAILGGICRTNVMYMEYPASGRYAQPYLVGGRNDALLLSVLQQLFSFYYVSQLHCYTF